MEDCILQVRDLAKYFHLKGAIPFRAGRTIKAVDGIDFSVKRGEALGIVGESGCGKSTLGKLILRLLKPTRGEVFFEGVDIFKLGRREFRKRRKEIQMVFQDTSASLNPRIKVGPLIAEPMALFRVHAREERPRRARELLEKVGLNSGYYDKYPHEISGGQRQRIGIARALAANPGIIVCDEPVSALDVSIQSQIINLLKDLQREYRLTYLFISHDLSVVRYLCDRVMVVYLGKVVEAGPAAEIFSRPRHPYTQALVSAIPVPDPEGGRKRMILGGEIPSLARMPDGCRFLSRCPIKREVCSRAEPALSEAGGSHAVACHCRQGRHASGFVGLKPRQEVCKC